MYNVLHILMEYTKGRKHWGGFETVNLKIYDVWEMLICETSSFVAAVNAESVNHFKQISLLNGLHIEERE